MLNAEKYRSQILDIIEGGHPFAVGKDKQNIVRSCAGISCETCIFNEEEKYGYGCDYLRIRWLLSEYKEPIKLTRLEFEILKWLDKGDYKFIVRSQGGNLMIYYSKPKRNDNSWFYINGSKILSGFNELFQFVQWQDKEPTEIKYILENCEVEEDV